MAFELIDGFDLYADTTGLAQTFSLTGTVGFNTGLGRFSGGAVTISTKGAIYYQLDATKDYQTVGFAIKATSLPSGLAIYDWMTSSASSTSNINAGVVLNSDGSLTIERDLGANLATSASGVIQVDTWHYVEVQIFRSTSSGTCEVFVDGISVVSAVGNTSDSNTGSIAVFGNGMYSTTSSIVIDDVYVNMDASALPATLGDCRIETLLPDTDTATADWTPLSGSGFSNIDDAVGTNGDGDTSYISATTLNDQSNFDVASLVASPTAIHAMAVNTRGSKDAPGTIAYSPLIDSGGTESIGASIGPAEGAYGMSLDIFETDPNTSAAWDVASINAVKVGVKITA